MYAYTYIIDFAVPEENTHFLTCKTTTNEMLIGKAHKKKRV